MIVGISLQALSARRGDRVLFEGLELRLSSGEAAVVVGPNGVGKTSLLRVIAGLLAPIAGEVVFASEAGTIHAHEARALHTHLLGHQDALERARTGREELLFQAAGAGGTTADALVAAERLGIERILDLEIRRLSAGQRRRLALARLLAAPRPLWLLDEPFASLDADGRQTLGEAMQVHLAGGGLLFAAAHDLLPVKARKVELGQ
ncbi:MAG: heme ABC exporter ATP-binding protein CcmA [Caulobacteraceae bacterium]